LKKRYPLKTRAQKPKIEKPAVRELLTAGVGGSDEIVVRWSNTAWNKFINPRFRRNFQQNEKPRFRMDTFDCFYNPFFCFFVFQCPISIKRDKPQKTA